MYWPVFKRSRVQSARIFSYRVVNDRGGMRFFLNTLVKNSVKKNFNAFYDYVIFAYKLHVDGRKLILKRIKTMQTEGIKQEAYKILDQLPDQATWDDLMQQIYVRQAIEAGIKDSDEGRTMDIKDVRRKFGLK